MGGAGHHFHRVLHSPGESSGVPCGDLGPTPTEHDQLLPDVAGDRRFLGLDFGDAVWNDSRTFWYDQFMIYNLNLNDVLNSDIN